MNKWKVRDNPTTRNIIHFMAYCGCKSLDELSELPQGEIDYLILKYAERIKHVGIEKNLDEKLESIRKFYNLNGITIKTLTPLK